MDNVHHCFVRITLLVLVSVLGFACASNSAQQNQKILKNVTEKKQEFDLNNDNKADAWRHYVTENGKKRLASKSFDSKLMKRIPNRYYLFVSYKKGIPNRH